MARLKLATVWLGGCSGCHMSFLDLDEWLIDLSERADDLRVGLLDIAGGLSIRDVARQRFDPRLGDIQPGDRQIDRVDRH